MIEDPNLLSASDESVVPLYASALASCPYLLPAFLSTQFALGPSWDKPRHCELQPRWRLRDLHTAPQPPQVLLPSVAAPHLGHVLP
jgi:hypothetical protein